MRAAASAALAALWLSAPARAGEARGQEALRSFEDLTNKAARDAAYIATPFLRPTRAGLLMTGVAAAGFGIASQSDRSIRTQIQKKRNSFHEAFHELEEKNWIESIGRTPGSVAAAGGFYVAGLYTGERERRVSFLIMETFLFNSMATAGLKTLFGRNRPRGNAPGEYKPFSDRDSLPSGHASAAFALAATVSLEYDSWWAVGACYGTASAVAWSRLQRDVHWFSDDVAGAALGILIARTVRSLYFQDNRDWGILFDGQRVAVERRF